MCVWGGWVYVYAWELVEHVYVTACNFSFYNSFIAPTC